VATDIALPESFKMELTMLVQIDKGRKFLLIIALLAVTFVAAPARAQVTDSESVTMKASIEAIDKTARTVTLKGPRGNLVTLQAGESFKRFDQLKVGDVVTATFTLAVAARIRKPGDPEPKEVKESLTPLTEKVGAKAYAEQTITVSVEEIDRTAPSVTVKTPDGRVLSFRVKNAANLKNLKVGDQVDITVSLGLLLSVDPPPAG
jgi:Cu/Ag efflux protein CusF